MGLQKKYSSCDQIPLQKVNLFIISVNSLYYSICSSIFAKRMYIIFKQIDPSKELPFLFWQTVSLLQAEHVYKFEECRVSKKNS
jgi:hypothetical protein